MTSNLLRHIIVVFIAVICFDRNIAVASHIDDVHDFLRKNVANRTVTRESDGLIAGGAVAFEFHRNTTICNLVRIPNGLVFDLILSIKQRNWDVKESKKHGEARIKDRVIVQRCTLAELESTGELMGYVRVLTATNQKWASGVVHVSMKLNGDKLEVTKETGKYMDFFDSGGDFYPGASLANEIWSIKDDLLVMKSNSTVFRVDALTGDRTVVGSPAKEAVDVETARLP